MDGVIPPPPVLEEQTGDSPLFLVMLGPSAAPAVGPSQINAPLPVITVPRAPSADQQPIFPPESPERHPTRLTSVQTGEQSSSMRWRQYSSSSSANNPRFGQRIYGGNSFGGLEIYGGTCTAKVVIGAGSGGAPKQKPCFSQKDYFPSHPQERVTKGISAARVAVSILAFEKFGKSRAGQRSNLFCPACWFGTRIYSGKMDQFSVRGLERKDGYWCFLAKFRCVWDLICIPIENNSLAIRIQ
ncbi:hypothetical protein F5876DRAFT_68315 [Lentinula aff. lateritia]|uniref:Uncharacterized protein n=1 Tax=Lentinula aff. lateritia TaxID=2804960 RepID=A0ACC1TRP9_9AGAR|nr:hypothetical protein F5876DRAFT_68315 [Lentinula aff. lateritia]